MNLTLVSQDADVTTVRAAGRVSLDAFAPEEEPLARQFGDGIYASRLLLALDGADFIDSRGVGWLLMCHRRFHEAGGALVLYSIPPTILEVLQVLHMDRVLATADDESSARAMVTGAAHG